MKPLTSLPGLLACAPLLVPTPQAQDAPPPVFLAGAAQEAFLAEVEEKMTELESVVAEFEQIKVLTLFEDSVRSSGVILFQAPDALRWEVTEPFQSLFVVAGDDVSKFEFSGGERRALDLGRGKDPLLVVMGQIRGWFRGDFGAGGRAFRMRVAREPTPLVLLEPADERVAKTVAALEVSLSPELDCVRRVVVRERGGDHTTMNFAVPLRGVELTDAYFDLTDPCALELEDLRHRARAAEAQDGR